MIPIIKLKGSTYEMGVQEGKQIYNIMHKHPFLLPFIDNHFKKGFITKEDAFKKAYQYANIIEKYYPEYIDEIKGLGEGAKCGYEYALLHNLRRFILTQNLDNYVAVECSGFVATGDATKDGKAIAAHNDDFKVWADTGSMEIAHGRPNKAYRWVIFTYAGKVTGIAHAGMNNKGLTCVGFGLSPRKKESIGFPTDFLTRVALDNCKTVDEVIDRVIEIPKWSVGKGNFVWVDAHGYVARTSISPTHPAITLSKDYYMAGTNHWVNAEWDRYNRSFKGDKPNTYYRYERLIELLNENFGKIDVEISRNILADHKNLKIGKSICRHPQLNDKAPHATCYNTIIKPSDQKMWICEGPPCKTKLKYYMVINL